MPMNQEHTQAFKGKLEAEKSLLEKELATVGRVNPENKTDWEPIPSLKEIFRLQVFL